jgi:hypothetical protein
MLSSRQRKDKSAFLAELIEWMPLKTSKYHPSHLLEAYSNHLKWRIQIVNPSRTLTYESGKCTMFPVVLEYSSSLRIS